MPVADVRAVPDHPAQSHEHDPNQETQLLAGERVRVHRLQGDWAFIEAIEQPEYTHHQRWEGYPGWVLRSSLQPLSPEEIRQLDEKDRWPVDVAVRRHAIGRAAEAFLGTPYLWGGRSPLQDGTVTGVDCSGLVNLAYRSVGMQIPRDAHEQWMRARPIEQLEPADLIFLSEANHPKKIVHVMLYAGHDEVVEAPGTGQMVRRIRLKSRLGRTARELKSGDVIGNQTVFLGTYFSE